MRQSGRMLATVLQLMIAKCQPGITSRELALLGAKELESLGGEPAFKGVPGPGSTPPFPDVVCISINEEVQHSIPSSRVVQVGDLVNFDFGVRYQGMITDAGTTVAVGPPSPDHQRLLLGTSQALQAGLAR